jgi:hypothetical protein
MLVKEVRVGKRCDFKLALHSAGKGHTWSIRRKGP